MKYLETGSTDPYFNLAFEEYYLTHAGDEDILILWQNDNTAVIGLNQNVFEEINMDYVSANGVHVVRRMTGGGAVYHDLGNLNYSLITKISNTDQVSVVPFMKIICNALASFGINAELSGRNDITVEGKKVSGTAQRVYHDHILHHGTLLFSSDQMVMQHVLTPSQLKFSSKSMKSVRSRVGNISDWLEQNISIMDFWSGVKKAIAGDDVFCIQAGEEELKEIEDLAEKKYRRWEWNFGDSPAFSVSRKKKYPGGIIEFRAEVADGRIEKIRFYGDYLAVTENTELCKRMQGLRFTPEEISKVLDTVNVASVFGALTKEQIMDLMFQIDDMNSTDE